MKENERKKLKKQIESRRIEENFIYIHVTEF